MDSFAPLTTELAVLGWSVVLLLVHVALQRTRHRRSGPRLERRSAGRGGKAPRHVRRPRGACARELPGDLPRFVALALGLAVSGRSGGIGEIGAALDRARVVYIPLYLFGVPYIRICLGRSLLGLVLMLVRFL